MILANIYKRIAKINDSITGIKFKINRLDYPSLFIFSGAKISSVSDMFVVTISSSVE